MATAFLTGCNGQDGSFLSEHLLEQGFKVCGILRRKAVSEEQTTNIKKLPIETVYGDVTDPSSIDAALHRFKPDFIFHLAAMSQVRISFDIPHFTSQVNALGTLNMLEAARRIVPGCRFYTAASSECFGLSVDNDGFQRETTPMNPTSPYGISKVFAFNATRHYRRAYGMHASCGILFNHCSERRGSNFVEMKIAKTAVDIVRGRTNKLHLGNVWPTRDWGASQDYVRAMLLMLQLDKPDDYVVATGVSRSVYSVVEYVFGKLGLDIKRHLETNDERQERAEELPDLRGDASKARKILGWKPKYTFEDMLDQMIERWMKV